MPDAAAGYLRYPGHAAVSRWLVALNNRLPLLGGPLRRQAIGQITRLATRGNQAAAWALASLVDTHFDAEVRARAAGYLPGAPAKALAAAWEYWSLARGKSLGEVLLRARPAQGAPDDVLALSLLYLQHMAALQSSTPGMVVALARLTGDRDAVIASRARYAIAHLTSEKGISALCQLWIEQRDSVLLDAIVQAGYQPDTPPRAAVLVALKMNRLDRITQGGEAILATALAACADVDDEIRARAFFCLLNLQKQETIDALCAEWAEKRGPLAEKILLQAGYVARHPARNRLLAALKINRTDISTSIQPDELPVLLAAIRDQDTDIAARAQSGARQLQLQPTRDRLCQMVIEEDAAEARKIALEAGYLPSDPAQRAVFLFLTNQMQAYDTLDYDQRLLNAVYETAGQGLRQRIIRRIQQTGRQDYLTILAGADYRSRAAKITPIEAQLLVQMLAEHHQWDRLWALARELPLEFAVDILRRLSASGWQPAEPLEQPVFAALCELAKKKLLVRPDDLARVHFPPAIPRATLNVRGRVNDLAFAPSGTLLAIGTGNRRVALWDYHHAALTRVYQGFGHSVGNVAYTGPDCLVCAERAASGPCGVYVIDDHGPARIGQHSQPVTALEPWRDGFVLSTGRDGQILLWDTNSRSLYRSTQTDQWPRTACVSAECDRAAMWAGGMSFLTLPDLDSPPLVSYRWARGTQAVRGVIRSAAFLPDSEDVLAGLFNGHVILFQRQTKPVMRPVSRFPMPVEGVRHIPGHPLIAVAGSNSEVRFFSLPDLKLSAKVMQKTTGRLTSLHISPDGAFMATGGSDSSMTLWDLRVLDIPELFASPLASATPGQIPAVLALSEYPDLPDALRNAILILGHLLQLRFRYDIQVSEIPTIPVGEFDVVIDE